MKSCIWRRAHVYKSTSGGLFGGSLPVLYCERCGEIKPLPMPPPKAA